MVLIFDSDIRGPEPGCRDDDPLKLRTLFIVPYRLWSKVPQLEPPVTLDHPVTHIIVSWTNTPTKVEEGECTQALWDLQDQYRKLGLDIPYNFVVCGDCNVYECRGWHAQPAPCVRHPHLTGKAVEIAHLGVKPDNERRPHTGMALQVINVGDYGIKKGYIRDYPGFLPDYEIMYGTELSKHRTTPNPEPIAEGLDEELDPKCGMQTDNLFDVM